MLILVAAASKHGATTGIARTIADELRWQGLECELREPGDVQNPEIFDAFVLGSAVYAGRWQKPARAFVDEHAGLLAGRPVWLFSSGPLSDDEQTGLDKRELQHLLDTCRPRAHRIFAGKLDLATLGRGERVLARAFRAPQGDFRDWDAIRNWARDIAGTLKDVRITAR
jgi:menaquinone-dependent protoporphyrinogen oxidase